MHPTLLEQLLLSFLLLSSSSSSFAPVPLLAIRVPTVARIVTDVIGFIILWIIVSIPVYFAARLVVGRRISVRGRVTFGEAMLATLAGPIIFFVVLAVGYVLATTVSGSLGILALFLAFLAWVWVYKAVFRTGWLHALGIAILSVIISIIIVVLLGLIGFAFASALPRLALGVVVVGAFLLPFFF